MHLPVLYFCLKFSNRLFGVSLNTKMYLIVLLLAESLILSDMIILIVVFLLSKRFNLVLFEILGAGVVTFISWKSLKYSSLYALTLILTRSHQLTANVDSSIYNK